ncbi:MAG: c-type cytochrome [Planctomycetes bacterium]|nr:c-type cytochrome [Planctomycetota bacterium]
MEADPKPALELAGGARIELLRRSLVRRAAARVGDLEPLMAHLARSGDGSEQLLCLDETLRAFEGHVSLPMPDGWKPIYAALSRSADPAVRERADAIAVKLGDRRVFPSLRRLLADRGAPLDRRERALSILLDGGDAEAVEALMGLLDEPALRPRALKGLSRFDDARVPAAILARYASLPAEEKVDAVATLAARPASAKALLEAVRSGKVPRVDLGAVAIRQLRGLRDPAIDEAIAEAWGTVREASEDRRAEIQRWKEKLAADRLANADPRAGRVVFARACQTCHMLFGAGGKVAPDITGSDRANLDYVLENILDPNAVVGKDYLASVFAARDGLLVMGLVTAETETAYTVRTANEEVLLPKKDVASRTESELSLMPEDLLVNLKEEEVRDLVAYLASPAQVLLPGSSVKIDPGTKKAPGVLEGEDLKVLQVTGGNAGPQDMVPFGDGLWSAGKHLWWTGGRPGSRLELRLPVAKAATYALEVALTQAPDYGVVQLDLDGRKLESPVDLYHPRVVPTGPTLLGELSLEPGDHVLGVEIVGTNPRAVKAFMFAIDYALLVEKA